MTNCLFARGVKAMTGELTVRFLQPVTVNCVAVIRARVTRSRPPLHTLSAELTQSNRVAARAGAKFMEVADADNAIGTAG